MKSYNVVDQSQEDPNQPGYCKVYSCLAESMDHAKEIVRRWSKSAYHDLVVYDIYYSTIEFDEAV